MQGIFIQKLYGFALGKCYLHLTFLYGLGYNNIYIKLLYFL